MFEKKLWRKIYTIVPFQCPVGKSELDEVVHITKFLTKLAMQKWFEIHYTAFTITELKSHDIVMQIIDIDNPKRFKVFHIVYYFNGSIGNGSSPLFKRFQLSISSS